MKHALDLWTVDPTAWAGSEAACLELLSDDERDHLGRLAALPVRHEYLLTRALVRTTLARYLPHGPRELRFHRDAYGRPHLVGDGGIDFNVSHTRGLIVCLVGPALRLGVDTEHTGRQVDVTTLARVTFARSELDELARSSASGDEARRRAFFTRWTLKEAYAKALGVGLEIDFTRVPFRFEQGRPTLIAPWEFAVVQPTAHHVVSIAVETRGGRGLHLDVHTAPPPGEALREAA